MRSIDMKTLVLLTLVLFTMAFQTALAAQERWEFREIEELR